jgi:excisionase family DNA binding protein
VSAAPANVWLRTEQVAAELGVTSEWVRRQIAAGRLAARRFQTGDRAFYRIRRSDLEKFVSIYSRFVGPTA